MTKSLGILKWSLISVALVLSVGVLALAGFAVIPPKPYPPPRPALPDQSAFQLDEKVGWYDLDDGSRQLISWGADGSLTLTNFQTVRNYYFLPKTADEFTWVDHRKKLEYPLRFQRGDGGAVAGFTWVTEDGAKHSAQRHEDIGYRQSEARFSNGGVELAGLLLSPLTPGPHPAVVFIHGSGASDRDMLWYFQMGDYLAQRGIVVLLPDKRGCGRSKGLWQTSSFDDYAGDALAAVRHLRETYPEPLTKVGLIGMSQGGWVAPLAATKSSDVDFIVLFSGSVTPLMETALYELDLDMCDAGCPGWLVPLAKPIFMRRTERRTPDFWRINGAFDPLPYWKQLAVPALVMNGEKDRNVPVAKSLARLEEIRKHNPKAAITVRIYPDSGHGIDDSKTHWTRTDALQEMAGWIGQVSREDPAAP
jgi:alpha-beta hydrolase superfamily lysophospholipase